MRQLTAIELYYEGSNIYRVVAEIVIDGLYFRHSKLITDFSIMDQLKNGFIHEKEKIFNIITDYKYI